jgi:hypothetical protein
MWGARIKIVDTSEPLKFFFAVKIGFGAAAGFLVTATPRALTAGNRCFALTSVPLPSRLTHPHILSISRFMLVEYL